MNKILCAVDFSDASINAIEHAAAVAEACGASLTLFHVFTEQDFNNLYEEDEDHVNRTFNEKTLIFEEKLKAITEEINAGKAGIRNINYRLEFGEFKKTVDELIDEGYDLMVMGTRGVTYREGLILGSNTLDIISQTDISVLAVPQSASFHPYTYIIYASDLHEKDKTGLNKLIPIANNFDARIQIVHFTSKSAEKSKEEFSQFVTDIKTFIQYPKLSYELKHYDDELNLAMEEYISDKKGYLLALLDKKHNFFESLFHESLIKRMSYITDTPLLILKS